MKKLQPGDENHYPNKGSFIRCSLFTINSSNACTYNKFHHFGWRSIEWGYIFNRNYKKITRKII